MDVKSGGMVGWWDGVDVAVNGRVACGDGNGLNPGHPRRGLVCGLHQSAAETGYLKTGSSKFIVTRRICSALSAEVVVVVSVRAPSGGRCERGVDRG